MPCIIESLKTIDNKQFYKIANVSQMLIVQDPNNPSFFKDNTTPHGLSECLRNVRTQRFRKRMSKKIIEDVEAEVERLLLADIEAEQLQYEVHERKDGDESVLGDDDFDMGQSEAGDANVDDFDLDTEIKEALEAEPEEEQEQEQEQESEEESDNEESENEGELDEGSDGDNDEKSQWKKQRNALKNEIQDLEKKVAEKEGAASKQINPIMKVTSC
jgi:transcription initiation factor TFIID subunit 7